MEYFHVFFLIKPFFLVCHPTPFLILYPKHRPPSCVHKLACLVPLLFSLCNTCMHTHTNTHTESHQIWDALLSFSNFNIAEIAICLAILDLMKYGMDIHIYIWEPFPSLFVLQKNLIMFYLFFWIFLSLLICGNPSKKSDKTLILFKHVLSYIHYSTSDGPSFFSLVFVCF